MIIEDWTAAANTLPDDDVLVLLALSDEEVWPGFKDGDVWRYVDATVIESSSVTHWMHFPPAPTRTSWTRELPLPPKTAGGA